MAIMTHSSTVRKQEMAQRRSQAEKALRLYNRDSAAARKHGTTQPTLTDYVVTTYANGPRELLATDYAAARFGELSNKGVAR